MQCIVSNLSIFVVFTLYFVSLVKKVRVCYSLIPESCKLIYEITFFIGVRRLEFDCTVGLIKKKRHRYSANALMHISTWCMSRVGQWLFYSFDIKQILFSQFCCHFCLQAQEGAKNHNNIVCLTFNKQ